MAKEILKNDIDVRGAYTSSNAQVIEVNSETTALRVTQRGTGNCLVVEDSTSTDTTPFVINQYGSVGVGLIPTNDPTSGPRLTVNGDFSTSSINTEASNDIAFIKANKPTEPPFTNNNYKKYIYSGPGGYVDFMGGGDGVSQNSVVFNFSDVPISQDNYDSGSTVTVDPFTVAYIEYDGSAFYTVYTKNLYPPTIDSQIINANSTSSALRITQIGTGNALVVEDSTNPDSTAFVITSSGNVGVGTLSPIEKLTVVGNISATGNIATTGGNSNNWNSVYSNVQSNSANWVLEDLTVSCSDETTDLATNSSILTFRVPFAMYLNTIRASVNVAPVGSAISISILENGSSILSTPLTIDVNEKTSTTADAPVVISDRNLLDDAEIIINLSQVGSTTPGKGLKVTFKGYRII